MSCTLSRAQRAFLFRKALEAVNPGGALLVYDRMLNDGLDHAANLMASLSMLLVTEGDGEYPLSEIYEHASAAGVSSVTDQPLGDNDTLSSATWHPDNGKQKANACLSVSATRNCGTNRASVVFLGGCAGGWAWSDGWGWAKDQLYTGRNSSNARSPGVGSFAN
jgi:hypothetical protein